MNRDDTVTTGSSVGGGFTDYNDFWIQYITSRATQRGRTGVGARRLSRDRPLSHTAIAALLTEEQEHVDQDDEDDEEGSTAVVAPSPFDYIASVMERSQSTTSPRVVVDLQASPSPAKTPRRTPPRWDVEAAKSALCDAAKLIRDDGSSGSSPQEGTHTSSDGITGSRGVSLGRRTPIRDEDEVEESSPVVVQATEWADDVQVPVEGVPRRLFSLVEGQEQGAFRDEPLRALQEINLSDVSIAMSSDCDVTDRSLPSSFAGCHRSVASTVRPVAPPSFVDVDDVIRSRHADGGLRTARLPQGKPTVSAQRAALSRLYGTQLRPEEWQNEELVAFLAFQEDQMTQRRALFDSSLMASSEATTATPLTPQAALRRAYGAVRGRRPPLVTRLGDDAAPVVFVAPPQVRAPGRFTNPAPSSSAGRNVLTPASPPSRFIEWIADDVDIYLDLVLHGWAEHELSGSH